MTDRTKDLALFGVDFSGGVESERFGNRKIWVAGWTPGEQVWLRCGWCDEGERSLCRCDLPALIAANPGWWSLDFPFGVARDTATAIGLNPNSWQAWLDWCSQPEDPGVLRLRARKQVEKAGVRWALRREVDIENQTTWFALFEQLYRQTIYGAREVLSPLSGLPGVCLLPWGCRRMSASRVFVTEGFPGITIRRHLLGQKVSYKGSTTKHAGQRKAIVRALQRPPYDFPISAKLSAIAVENQDGDAVDALALLAGSWHARRVPAAVWRKKHDYLASANALIEGWFPS
jgi:hypothetical protein